VPACVVLQHLVTPRYWQAGVGLSLVLERLPGVTPWEALHDVIRVASGEKLLSCLPAACLSCLQLPA